MGSEMCIRDRGLQGDTIRFFILTLAFFVLVSSGSVTAQITPGSKDLGAIWLVGDSITQSNADGDPDSSPRSALFDLLTANDFSFSFTGHRTNNIEGLPVTGSTPATNLFQYHSGVSGAILGDTLRFMTGMTQNLPSHWNSGRLATVKPNIILIMLGTNDIGVEAVSYTHLTLPTILLV